MKKRRQYGSPNNMLNSQILACKWKNSLPVYMMLNKKSDKSKIQTAFGNSDVTTTKVRFNLKSSPAGSFSLKKASQTPHNFVRKEMAFKNG